MTILDNNFYVSDGKTLMNQNCFIPFQFNNEESYFCVLQNSQFQCAVNENNDYDSCNLGINYFFIKTKQINKRNKFFQIFVRGIFKSSKSYLWWSFQCYCQLQ